MTDEKPHLHGHPFRHHCEGCYQVAIADGQKSGLNEAQIRAALDAIFEFLKSGKSEGEAEI